MPAISEYGVYSFAYVSTETTIYELGFKRYFKGYVVIKLTSGLNIFVH